MVRIHGIHLWRMDFPAETLEYLYNHTEECLSHSNHKDQMTELILCSHWFQCREFDNCLFSPAPLSVCSSHFPMALVFPSCFLLLSRTWNTKINTIFFCITLVTESLSQAMAGNAKKFRSKDTKMYMYNVGLHVHVHKKMILNICFRFFILVFHLIIHILHSSMIYNP